MADTPWNTIDPLPAGKNQDIELLVKSNGANYREKAEQIMQAFSGLGTVDGSCSSAIDAEEKTVTLSEYTLNVLPREFSVTFTNANTYGNGTTTYPILKVYNNNNQLLGSLPAANSRGRYAANGAWEAGDILYFRVMAGRACIINSEISTTRDLQARVKDMTLSALDLTEANKTLPVNSEAVSGDLQNYVLNGKNFNRKAREIFSSYNFNDYNQSGFYRIDALNHHTNAPVNCGDYGQLIVSKNGDTVFQLYQGYNTGRIASRCFSLGGGGTDWIELSHKARTLTVIGDVMNCDTNTDTNVLGKGRVIITLDNGVAKIDFSIYITRNGNGNLFGVGLNRDMLKNLDNSIPQITPVKGICHFYNEDGSLNTNLEGLSGNITGVGQYWQFGRIYTEDMDTGGWPASQYQRGMRITGTCYGTY